MKKTVFTILSTVLCISVYSQSLSIVFDGDSQTASGTWPLKIISMLQAANYSTIRYANYAVIGQTTSMMTSDVTSQIVPRYNASYDENIVLYYIGYNDTWAGSSLDATAMYNRLLNYYNTLKAAGFKVVMINLPDGLNRTGISIYNNMYADRYADICDAYVNCRQTGGVFEDYTNTLYYRDNVHLSTTGLNYLAEKYVYPKLMTLIDAPAPPLPPVTGLLTGLESYYKFDETSGVVKDETGASNGTASPGLSKVSGKSGGAWLFDGNSDYISLSKSYNLKTATYSFWMKVASISDDLLIMANDAYYSRIFIGANNNLKLETNTNGQEFAFYRSFSPATWYHIALVRDNDYLTVYINGTASGTAAIGSSNSLTVSQFGFNGRSFRGTLDEVGIWSRALTSAEISTIYQGTYPFSSGGTPPPPVDPEPEDPVTPPTGSSTLMNSLRAYYKLDETSGNARDETGNNHGIASANINRLSGKINGAYHFDSNSDYISLSSSITHKTATYSFWIKILSITDDLLILGSNSYQSRIFIGANNNIKLETNTNGQEFSFYNAFSTNTWYHVALVRDNDNLMYYRNGVLVGTSYIAGSGHLTFSQIGFNGRSFRGAIDEVGIWDRALTSQEVAQLNTGLSYPFNGLKSTAPDVNEQPAETVLFYPNPASEVLYLAASYTKAEILDLQGKLVLQQTSGNQILLNGFKNGIYLLRLTLTDRVITEKLIIQ